MSRPSCVPDRRRAAGRSARQRCITAALLAACLAGAGFTVTAASPARQAVVAVELDGAGVIGHLPLAPEERLGVSFIHSVDQLPVEDWYVLRNGSLVQVSTRLKQYGAGMGHIAGEGRGHADGDWWEVSGMDRQIGTLALRVGPASVDHRLLYRGQVVSLSSCWPGQRLTFRPATTTATRPLMECNR